MADVPYIEPKRIIIGEKLHWKKEIEDYPATEYTLAYRFRGTTGEGFNVTATADGTVHEVSVAATVTANLTAEVYRWQAWITEIADSTNTFVVAEGPIDVQNGFDATSLSAVDPRTQAELILEAIDATIESRATNDQLRYKIASGNGYRELEKLSLSDLLVARDKYANIVAREKQADSIRRGEGFFKNILIRSWRHR